MSSPLHAPVVLLALLWLIFFIRLYRSYQTGKLQTTFSRWLWLATFFGALVVTLSGEDVERALDRLVGNVPLTFYVKFVCALIVIQALYFMLRSLTQLPGWLDRLFCWGCLITIGIGLATFPAFFTLPVMAKAQLRYALLALREGVGSIYMLFVFIPVTYDMWQKETILPMKLRHFIGLMFDLSYLLLAMGNILTFIASLESLKTAAFVDRSFRPSLSLCILYFMLSGVPHRLLAMLFWPQRWLILRCLQRLEARIIRWVPVRVDEPFNPEQEGLEGRIYESMIFILDHYSVLEREPDQTLYQNISRIIQIYPDYSQLVEQLAKLT